MDEVSPVVQGDRYCKLVGTEAWAVFLCESYISGHRVIRIQLKGRSNCY